LEAWLADSRRLLAEMDRQADAPDTSPIRVMEIRSERRARIAVFQRIGEPWK